MDYMHIMKAAALLQYVVEYSVSINEIKLFTYISNLIVYITHTDYH